MQESPLSPDEQRRLQRGGETLHKEMGISRLILSSDEDLRRLDALYSFITNWVMKGTFPERTELSGITRMLDISCATGFWTRTVASANPEIEVIGVDGNVHLIEFARAHARGLGNVQFTVMDFLEPMLFPEPFDLVNAYLLSSVVPAKAWPLFVKDCLKLLRPGGVLRLTDAEYPMTTSYSCERFGWWFGRALKLSGLSFSPDGRQVGITPMLGYLLRTGIEGELSIYRRIRVERRGYSLDCSANSPVSADGRRNIASVLSLIRPFLEANANMLETTSEEIAQTYRQALVDIARRDFSAVCYMLSVWAVKPQG